MLPSMEVDPFEILGLAPRFDLNDAEIRAAFLRKVSIVHPDFVGDGESEAASVFNLAREILENPERRANALLSRLGGPTKEQDRTLPGEFLMEIMDTRQEIESDLAAGEPGRREHWNEWVRTQRSMFVARVGALFRDDPARPEQRAAIRRELNAWRYIERLSEQLSPDYHPGRPEPGSN